VVRAEREVVVPSGKGIGSSLVIHELRGDTVALGLNAGRAGKLLGELLDEAGVAHRFIPACGETRRATVLIDRAAQRQSTIAAPTLTATSSHLAQSLDLLDSYAGSAWGIICGGSLPPGLPPDSYAWLLRHSRQLGLVTLLDTSGEALRQGVAGQPHILRVNHHEIEALAPGVIDGGQLTLRANLSQGDGGSRSPGDVLRLVRRLRRRLGHWATDALIVTLGELGALAVTPEDSYYVQTPEVPPVNTAGAGDALNGGLMLALSRGEHWRMALALGTSAAASVVMTAGTAICHREQVADLLPQVNVLPLENGT
jgi:1-phosphofructokinase family hexose kinase